MEPPSPSAGLPDSPGAAGPPAPHAYPWMLAGRLTARRAHAPWLPVRARADVRMLTGAAAGGVCLDAAARAGLSTIAGTCWVVIAAASLLLGGRIRGRTSLVSIAAAIAYSLLLSLRSSPWVIAPVTVVIAMLLILGASLGADGGGLTATFPALADRLERAAGHLGAAPGMLKSAGPGGPGPRRGRAAAAGRGALLGIPVLLVVGWLLATADPVFRSLFNLGALAQHLLFIAAGGWAVLGLSRVASAQRPVRALPPGPSLGTVEASVILGGLSALYAAFVAAQFEALSGAGHRILITRGLTYAQYARSGFFELLGCAAITLLLLLGVRACAGSGSPALTWICGLTIALTIGVVITAIRRLQLYEAAFGLTMLRLACLAAAAWIGVVFLLLAATLVRRGLPRRLFPAAMIISGLVLVAGWGIANPAGFVARTDAGRARSGMPFDVSQAAGLGPDAVPALLASLPGLAPRSAALLRRALCGQPRGKDSGTAVNLSRLQASRALTRACRPLDAPAAQASPQLRLGIPAVQHQAAG